MNNQPLVSVIIACFNAEYFIEQCINSILSQTYENYEIIIVNDASTDRTEEIIKNKFLNQNKKIFYLKNKKNMERSYSRNRGVAVSKGEIIAFLDADDIWGSMYLEKGVNLLMKNDADILVSFPSFIDKNGKAISKKGYDLKWIEHLSVDEMIARGLIPFVQGLLIKKNLFLNSGGFSKTIDMSEDWELLSRIYFKYNPKVVISFDSTYCVRIHESNTSASFEAYKQRIIARDIILEYIRNCKFINEDKKKKLMALPYLQTSIVHFSWGYLRKGWGDWFRAVKLNTELLYDKSILYILKHGFLPKFIYNLIKNWI